MYKLRCASSDSLDPGLQFGVDQGRELRRVVQGIAAAERLLLRQLSETEEALRPAAVPKSAAASRNGEPVYTRRDDTRAKRPGDACWYLAPRTHARCLR